MQTSKNGRDHKYAKPTRAPDDLCPPIDEALEHILLHESPTKTQSQLAKDWPAGMPSQKIYFAAKPPARERSPIIAADGSLCGLASDDFTGECFPSLRPASEYWLPFLIDAETIGLTNQLQSAPGSCSARVQCIYSRLMFS